MWQSGARYPAFLQGSQELPDALRGSDPVREPICRQRAAPGRGRGAAAWFWGNGACSMSLASPPPVCGVDPSRDRLGMELPPFAMWV
jgi:hypothetical protein